MSPRTKRSGDPGSRLGIGHGPYSRRGHHSRNGIYPLTSWDIPCSNEFGGSKDRSNERTAGIRQADQGLRAEAPRASMPARWSFEPRCQTARRQIVAPNRLTALTELAVQLFPHIGSQPLPQYPIHMDDKIFNFMQETGHSFFPFRDQFQAAVPVVFPESVFAPILAKEDDRTPMLLTVNGGSRVTPDQVLSDIFASAWLQMILFQLRNDETTFVKLVHQNYQELEKAVRGEKVPGFNVNGISGISLSEGMQVSTPWGTLLPAPKIEEPHPTHLFSHRPETTCILVEKREMTILIDLAAQPEPHFDYETERGNHNAGLLFALSCVFSLDDEALAGGPIQTWSTDFLPFICPHGGSYPTSPTSSPEHRNIDEKVAAFETWAKMIAVNHSEEMDFAASRLVSAIVHRLDVRDSLVDAVMVWENLVGARSEVSFRVTTALTKLLKPDADLEERRSYRKTLRDAYNTRSDIVHGVKVDYNEAKEKRDMAVSVAVNALRELYRRGEEWMAMSSNERADALLLSEK